VNSANGTIYETPPFLRPPGRHRMTGLIRKETVQVIPDPGNILDHGSVTA
jgi:hypothetical protein